MTHGEQISSGYEELSILQAARLCIQADQAQSAHYPAAALNVLDKYAQARNTTIDAIVEQARLTLIRTVVDRAKAEARIFDTAERAVVNLGLVYRDNSGSEHIDTELLSPDAYAVAVRPYIDGVVEVLQKSDASIGLRQQT